MRIVTINSRGWLVKLGKIGIFVLILGLMLGPVRGPAELLVSVMTGSNKLHPIYLVDTVEKKVAISFDACWGADYTRTLLDILKKYEVKTTFFLVNIWLKKYPDLAKIIVAEGHEIGLHSTSHPDFAKLSEEQIIKELQDNYDEVVRVTGFKPILFRPPFGSYNNTLIRVTQTMGIHAIQWDVDSLDWKDLSARQIYDRVTGKVTNGSIVLFHNNGKHTAEALAMVIENLQKRGFEIVPVSELIYKENYYVDVNGIQRKQP